MCREETLVRARRERPVISFGQNFNVRRWPDGQRDAGTVLHGKDQEGPPSLTSADALKRILRRIPRFIIVQKREGRPELCSETIGVILIQGNAYHPTIATLYLL